MSTLVFSPSLATAVKMDETTHDMVIHRLELGIDGMDKKAPERTGILLRLADLYADRARLKAMNEIEENCKNCHAAAEDRSRAISLYQDAFPQTEKADQGKLLLQIAHMYAMNEEADKAALLYQKILKAKADTYSSEVRGLALSSTAETEFRTGHFKEALRNFKAARRLNLKAKGLVEYRIAWCELNLGMSREATASLIHLLQSPDLLATQTIDGKTVDKTFAQDISRDLAVFLAHGEVGPAQIDLVKKSSAPEDRKANLRTLALETDRLGKKSSSLIAWAAYIELPDVTPIEKIETQVNVTQVLYDMEKFDAAANAYERALVMWKNPGCNDANLCPDLKQRLRRFAIAWNKAEHLNVSARVLRVYQAYINTFSDDSEMLHWAGIVAKDLKKSAEAAALFHRAAVQANIELQKDPTNKTLHAIFDGSLLAEIEMAEASSDPTAREQAYNYYLQMNPQGSRVFDVRYQRAHVYYDSNRYQEAFSEFHYLATQPADKAHHDLQLKSADLALDSLVALKDHKNIQVRSLEYARLFPERKEEYLKISRKATMTLVAQDVNAQKSAVIPNYKTDLAALGDGHLEHADDQEKLKFYKDKIVVAEKAMDFAIVTLTADKLLQVRSLKEDDREWAMAQQVWAAETELNFATAYRISKRMKMSELGPAERELRLALLAELAGLPTRAHNENYLRLAGHTRSANLVRVTLIKTSANPWRELDKHLAQLRQSPDLLAPLVLEIYAGHRDLNKVKALLHTTKIGQLPSGQILERHIELADFAKFDNKIKHHRLDARNDKVMKRTLKERLAMINECEKNAQAAFRRHDWTMQALNLTELARENRRLSREILQLPVPRQLSKADQNKYQQLIHSESQPYLTRASTIEAELNQMWNNSNSVQNLQNAFMTASNDLQKLYRDEIIPLTQIAPSSAKIRLQNLLNATFRRPSQRDLLVARQDLQTNPFDLSKAERLRELENQNNHSAMVAYLDERISQIKRGRTL